MQFDHQQLRELLALIGESDIQEFRLEAEDFRLEVRRNLPAPLPVAPAPGLAPAAVQAATPLSVSTSPSVPPPPAAVVRSDLVSITAPMVATFYRSPAPDEPPFVSVGDRVSSGQPVCILEAMKLMNELETETAGEVVEILVDNGTPVEFGQVLMRIRPS
ncbi:MAG: acetyl-CoA carboxylase biotin carboxyl carrier protein [Synechococcaceae cyanobacterium]|jgi:acetyl-CoA carboxylase biotin carboxyl carrier protein